MCKRKVIKLVSVVFIVLFNDAVNFWDYKTSATDVAKNKVIGGMILYRRNQTYTKNSAPLQLWSKHIAPGLAWCWTWNFVVTTRHLTLCAMARHSAYQYLNTLRTGLLKCLNARSRGLTFRHCRHVYRDRRFTTLQRTLFIYLIKQCISLSDICLTVHHWYK